MVTDPNTGRKVKLTGDYAPTEQELEQIFLEVSKPAEKSTMLTNPVETLKRSGGEFLSGIGQAVTHPITTAKGVGKIIGGVAQMAIPGEQDLEPYAEAVGKIYADRYGSIEKAKQTAITDPVGFLSDSSALLGGVGGLSRAAGTVSKVNQLTQAGKTVGAISKNIDPLSIAINAAGDLTKSITKGKTIGLPGNKVDTDLIKIANELNVNIPASSVSSSKVVPLAEAFSAKGPFGGRMSKRILTAKDQLVSIADDTVKAVGKSPDLNDAGNAIYKGAERFRDVYMKLKNRMYDKANISDRASKITLSPNELQDTSNFINEIMLKKQAASGVIGDVSDTGIFKKVSDAISGNKGTVNAYQVRSAIQELNDKLSDINDPVITGNKAAIRKMVATLSDDLDNAIINRNPELAQDIAKANAVYKRGLDMLNSNYGEKIFKFKDQPDKIVPALFNKNTATDDIPRIYTLIGSKNVPSVQSAVLEDIFSNAKNADGKFTPNGISRQIDKYGQDKLAKVLSPEQYDKVTKLNKLALSMGKAEKVTEGSQTAFSSRIGAELFPMFVNPALSLKLILGDAAFSNFVASPSGQKFLSTGITLTGKTGENIKKAAPSGRVISRASRVPVPTGAQVSQQQ